MRKLLLVTGTPPGHANVGGIILHDLLQRFGPQRCVCMAVTQQPDERRTSDLAELAFHHLPARAAQGKRSLPGRLGSCQMLCNTVGRMLPFAREIAVRIAALAEDEGVQQAWVVLDTPVLIAMAKPLAACLRVPMYPLIWDPPRYVMRLQGLDSLSVRLLYRRFAQAMSTGKRIAVASEEMKRRYEMEFGRPCVVVRYGLASALAVEPALAPPREQSTFTIGFAGSLYAHDAWQAFLGALDRCAWQIQGRSIRLRILSGDITMRVSGQADATVHGWVPESELSAILRQCDAFYLPYPFSSFYEEVVQLSFPTKLSTYVSLGKPVILHTPAASSLAEFYRSHPVGVLWTDRNPDALAPQLERLVADRDYYHKAAKATARAAEVELNGGVLQHRFDEFLSLH